MIKLAILLVVGVIAKHAYGDEPEAIVGGRTATPGQFPYQASLRSGGSHICGCSIIDEQHLVTAAHCFDRMDQNRLTVVTGAHNSRGDGQIHKIKCINIHSGYTGQQKDGWKDDIALLTLAAPMQFNNLQKPIALPSRDYATGQYRGIISGWGKTSLSSGVAPQLQWTGVNVLSQSACLAAYPNRGNGGAFTNPKQVCTLEKYGTGACSGDSGGPLVANNELVGTTSWVVRCALGVPDVFTNVYYYRDFIAQSIAMC